jgi:hypothetical protein
MSEIKKMFEELKKVDDQMKKFQELQEAGRRLSSIDTSSFRSMPNIKMPQIKVPTAEEIHRFESSGVLIARLEERVKLWQQSLSSNTQPAIVAILANGLEIRVTSLSQEGHNGIAIEGLITGKQCMVVAHQAGLQLLCYIEEVQDEKQRRSIGFNVSYQASEPEHGK